MANTMCGIRVAPFTGGSWSSGPDYGLGHEMVAGSCSWSWWGLARGLPRRRAGLAGDLGVSKLVMPSTSQMGNYVLDYLLPLNGQHPTPTPTPTLSMFVRVSTACECQL